MGIAFRDANAALQSLKALAFGTDLVQVVQPVLGTTPTIASKAQGTTNQVLLAVNANRISAKVYNDTSSGNLKISLGSAATASNFTVIIAPGSYYEVNDFSGSIQGLWDASGTGQALITEITP